MSKKIISILLAVVMLLAMGTVALVSVSADLASLPEVADGCNRYFFYMPPQWYNDYAYTAGIYWWEGTDACSSWPGYEANAADVDGVYYYDVPQDVTTVIWNNYLDGGTDATLGIYQAAVQTKNIGSEYYDPGESENYPNGTDSFDGMIYVTDMNLIETNAYSGKQTYAGEWCYYYGDGEYGFTPEKGDVVYSAPAFNWSEDATIPEDTGIASEDETTAAPIETTAAPIETTAAPVETSAAPVETTVASVETEATAAKASVEVDGVEYAVREGDTITYTVELTAAELFENIQAYVTYDSEMLELVRKNDNEDLYEEEIACPVLGDAIFNADIEGIVKFNASKVKGYNFKETGVLITLDFIVKDTAQSTIDLVIEEMTIKGDGTESYFTGGEAVITDGITVVETLLVPVDDTTTAPVETSAAPVETSAAPVETSAAPVETSAAPVVTEAPATTAAPTENDNTTNAPSTDPTSGEVEGTTAAGADAPITGAAAYVYVVLAVLAMASCAVVVLRKKVNG